jgi:hypothetical protein
MLFALSCSTHMFMFIVVLPDFKKSVMLNCCSRFHRVYCHFGIPSTCCWASHFSCVFCFLSRTLSRICDRNAPDDVFNIKDYVSFVLLSFFSNRFSQRSALLSAIIGNVQCQYYFGGTIFLTRARFWLFRLVLTRFWWVKVDSDSGMTRILTHSESSGRILTSTQKFPDVVWNSGSSDLVWFRKWEFWMPVVQEVEIRNKCICFSTNKVKNRNFPGTKWIQKKESEKSQKRVRIGIRMQSEW